MPGALTQVPGSFIFYHAYYQYLLHPFEEPRFFYNEFANGALPGVTNWDGNTVPSNTLQSRLR